MSGIDPSPIEISEGVVGVIADIHANPYALGEVIGHGTSEGVIVGSFSEMSSQWDPSRAEYSISSPA